MIRLPELLACNQETHEAISKYPQTLSYQERAGRGERYYSICLADSKKIPTFAPLKNQ
jgi:hypothetical protein